MSNTIIIDRIKTLYAALQFCSNEMKIFTVGERICINQERLQWLHILTTPKAEPRPVSVAIESKIKNISELTAFQKYNYTYTDPLLDELLTFII